MLYAQILCSVTTATPVTHRTQSKASASKKVTDETVDSFGAASKLHDWPLFHTSCVLIARDARKARRDPVPHLWCRRGWLMVSMVPVHAGDIDVKRLAADIKAYGIVVVDSWPSEPFGLADALLQSLRSDSEGSEIYVLHEHCRVSPASQFGWVDYYVIGSSHDRYPATLRKHVGDAVRASYALGRPSRHLFAVPALASEKNSL